MKSWKSLDRYPIILSRTIQEKSVLLLNFLSTCLQEKNIILAIQYKIAFVIDSTPPTNAQNIWSIFWRCNIDTFPSIQRVHYSSVT